MRRHNATCSNPSCSKTMYRRPVELAKFDEVFCSRECYITHRLTKQEKDCEQCGASFVPKRKEQKYCGKSCATKASRGDWGTNNKRVAKNSTILRREVLERAFGVSSCMVKDCSYSTTLDVHRLVSGKEGGEYVLGNMFLMCPNHHAEITRGFAKAEKLNEYTLKLTYGE